MHAGQHCLSHSTTWHLSEHGRVTFKAAYSADHIACIMCVVYACRMQTSWQSAAGGECCIEPYTYATASSMFSCMQRACVYTVSAGLPLLSAATCTTVDDAARTVLIYCAPGCRWTSGSLRESSGTLITGDQEACHPQAGVALVLAGGCAKKEGDLGCIITRDYSACATCTSLAALTALRCSEERPSQNAAHR